MIDLRLSFSGKMRRGAFWQQTLMLGGLTLLALALWGIAVTSIFSNEFFTMGDVIPQEVFGGWPTWALGVYGLWMAVTCLCMVIRRMHDVGKGMVLPILYMVFFVAGICLIIFEVQTPSEGAVAAFGILSLIIACILGLIILVYALRGSAEIEDENSTASKPAAAWGIALAPWALGILLYVTCLNSWVELAKGFSCIDEDEKTALCHFNHAAANGNKVAKMMVLINDFANAAPEALPEIREMAEDGNAAAQYLLANMYGVGYPGLEQNTEAALRWLKKAADQGHCHAIDKMKEISGHEGTGASED